MKSKFCSEVEGRLRKRAKTKESQFKSALSLLGLVSSSMELLVTLLEQSRGGR